MDLARLLERGAEHLVDTADADELELVLDLSERRGLGQREVELLSDGRVESPPASAILAATSVWQPAASIVTRQPLR